MIKSLLFLLLFSNSNYLNGQVSQEWVSLFSTTEIPRSQGNDVVSDSTGNIYVTGYASLSASNGDILTLKYNSSGQLLWERTYSSSGFRGDIGINIGVDNDQNILVSGYEGLNGVLVLIKYNSSGDTLWTERYQRSPSISITPIIMKIDNDGSIYLTLTTLPSGGGYEDYSVLKYLSDGSFQWVRHCSYGKGFNNSASSIALGLGNFFYVSNFSSNGILINGLIIKYNKTNGDSLWSNVTADFLPKEILLDDQDNIYAIGNKDTKYYLLKIDSDGNSMWNRVYDDSGGIAVKLGLDSNNNVYVGGYKFSSPPKISVLKYNEIGNLLWITNEYGVPSSNCFISDMLVEDNGNSYICGSNSQTYPYKDMLTIKYNSDGNKVWLMRYSYTGTSSDYANSLTEDPFGNIIVTGNCFTNPNDVCATIKYSQSVGIDLYSNIIPDKYSLSQNYPNPFNPNTIINFQCSMFNFISLRVFDVLGNEVVTLVNENKQPGSYQIEFDGSRYPSGVYLYRLKIDGNIIDTKRMILLK